MTDEIPRDRWGRPLVWSNDDMEKRVPYTRVSTLAKVLDDGTNLARWKTRTTVAGLLSAPMLLARTIAGDDVLDECFRAGGGEVASLLGTELHELSERLDAGIVHGPTVPITHSAWANRYMDTVEPLEMLATEVFVVNDAFKAAGTFDRLVRLPDGRVCVADLKTGRWDARYPMGVATQIAVYASGRRYMNDSGARSPIHPDLDPDVGVLIHVPADGSTPGLYTLDLVHGWECAETAARVLDLRKVKASHILGSL